MYKNVEIVGKRVSFSTKRTRYPHPTDFQLHQQKHQIPITAIPCLSYRKALEKEEKEALNNDTDETAVNGGDSNGIDGVEDENDPKPITTNAVIETVKENLEKQSLSAEQITEYCKKLFHFKEIRVMRFK